MLTILVEKSVLRFHKEGREYVYAPARSTEKARRGALRSLMSVFFGDSIESLLASHLSDPHSKVDDKTLKRLEKMIREVRQWEDQP